MGAIPRETRDCGSGDQRVDAASGGQRKKHNAQRNIDRFDHPESGGTIAFAARRGTLTYKRVR